MVSHEQETALLGSATQQVSLFCWNGFERLSNKRSLGEGDVAGSGREKMLVHLVKLPSVSDSFSLPGQLLVFPRVNMVRLLSALSLNRAECGGISTMGCHVEQRGAVPQRHLFC